VDRRFGPTSRLPRGRAVTCRNKIHWCSNPGRKLTPSDIANFPQPRLEGNERLEINDFRVQEEKALNSYGWVDQQAGVVHTPTSAP